MAYAVHARVRWNAERKSAAEEEPARGFVVPAESADEAGAVRAGGITPRKPAVKLSSTCAPTPRSQLTAHESTTMVLLHLHDNRSVDVRGTAHGARWKFAAAVDTAFCS